MKTIVLDVETKKSFDDVGGRDNLTALGVSVAGAYFYETDSFYAYEEHELPAFEARLEEAELVIGFNINNFDWPVLQPYFKTLNVLQVPTLDIFDDVTAKLGHRISLNALAIATLNSKKSSDGLQALQWFKEGRIAEVKEYCLKDVAITRDLYEYGKKNGALYFESKFGNQKRAVPVSWQEKKATPSSVFKTLHDAFQKRQRVSIEYVSRSAAPNEEFKKNRKIDIYSIDGKEISAYCHLRQSVRRFKIESILACAPVQEFYKAPQDVQSSLF
ncbi:MAG: hypothetical protein A3A28_02045 [Candidatus Sungbacteria bacterium RIFCSPLOWO2_01_FULL_47_32]|nr:MAG: hypothetical protein UX72_C0021G0004 [Parcubacteria group bacterium GW2011_GWA2_47_10]OHA00016.1 MAG: hypothetical protein A3D57_03765 [Candidatus Sungbacteria bacterium RIFCSPHIGHO2_02_FULL_46_12]OHA06252.1 MAG: hypothetical protein A3A28_02045 [Candidatus Sungbacteria bacterium RIFCSPLOWO2_01_FULL_47_32]